MHSLVFSVSIVWIAILFGIVVIQVIRSRSTTVRILALDTLTLLLIGGLALFALGQQTAYYLDAALILSLLSFLATVAAALYEGERRIL